MKTEEIIKELNFVYGVPKTKARKMLKTCAKITASELAMHGISHIPYLGSISLVDKVSGVYPNFTKTGKKRLKFNASKSLRNNTGV